MCSSLAFADLMMSRCHMQPHACMLPRQHLRTPELLSVCAAPPARDLFVMQERPLVGTAAALPW